MAEGPDSTPDAVPPEPTKEKSKRKSWLRRVVVGVIVLAVVGAAAAGGLAFGLQRLIEQPGPLTAETTVVVPRGTPVVGIATLLQDAGAVRHSGVFALAARWQGRERPMQAGEYLIPAAASVADVITILQSGAQVVRRLTVPEGLTGGEVMAIVAAAEALTGDVPPVGEGTVLPETYHYVHGESRDDVVARMARALDEALADLWLERADDLPLNDPEEALVLASIVERETSLDGERAEVAAVFINRLRRGMRLQSDPTVAYGLTENGAPLGRSLTRRDLRVEHPYNTYVIDRLPPGPIANPGRASIAAVLNPADSDALFFVADGTGGHAFAKTLEEHNRNVAKWRRFLRENGG